MKILKIILILICFSTSYSIAQQKPKVQRTVKKETHKHCCKKKCCENGKRICVKKQCGIVY